MSGRRQGWASWRVWPPLRGSAVSCWFQEKLQSFKARRHRHPHRGWWEVLEVLSPRSQERKARSVARPQEDMGPHPSKDTNAPSPKEGGEGAGLGRWATPNQTFGSFFHPRIDSDQGGEGREEPSTSTSLKGRNRQEPFAQATVLAERESDALTGQRRQACLSAPRATSAWLTHSCFTRSWTKRGCVGTGKIPLGEGEHHGGHRT